MWKNSDQAKARDATQFEEETCSDPEIRLTGHRDIAEESGDTISGKILKKWHHKQYTFEVS